ncbi:MULTISPECIES: hypothetical protein [Asaia]|uniref:Uncharacterized protein n=1 Tax=Asaia bogorensis TaxID=91915 RepID=A0A060QEP7_9PROT|nr:MULTISPECIES: hypothetical protein [Asaia]ETD00080.1 hypothetical protein P792_00540 [Asaia sp. SF2.1]CDG39604.1 hypothetical protein ASAP_1559 [Asaia bogorensis]
MSDTKNCECCSRLIAREMDVSDHNWSRRRFCTEKCRKKDERDRLKEEKSKAPKKRYHNTPISEDEAKQFADLVKSGVSAEKATKQVGRSSAMTIMNRAVAFGFIERPERVAPPVVEDKPKITRIDPLPPGDPATWGAIMPDMKWEAALSDTRQMGAI